jgi:hypothetical protein
MPTLIASNLTVREFELAKAASGHSSTGDGDLESGALTSHDASSLFVNVGSATPSELRALGVPTCCQGAAPFLSMCGACCLLTVALPLAVLLSPLSKDVPTLGIVAWVVLAAGLGYVLWSLRVTLTAGALTMPPPPPLASAFVNAGSGPEELRATKAPPKKLYVCHRWNQLL